MKNLFMFCIAVGLTFGLSMPVFAALDLTAVTASITAAQTDVESVAVLIIGVAAVFFGIAKIRQLLKA